MMVGVSALSLLMVAAGSGILRAPPHLLRSRVVLFRPEASADAHCGCPVPLQVQLQGNTLIRGALEGWSAQSARQHLPAGRDTGGASVASAVARGGRFTPRADTQRPTLPVLAFPEPGVDDTAAYQGYQTRFYRDSKDNTVQIYVQPQSSRVVLVWADGANESAGFTVRDAAGRPAHVAWGADAADVSDSGATRSIEYRLTADVSRVELGWFLLGSMRVERDFVYGRRHLEPFAAPPFRVAEESLLVADVSRLPLEERNRHLALLDAASVAALRARLEPAITSSTPDSVVTVRVARPSLDGRNSVALELRVDPRKTRIRITGRTVSIETRPGSPVQFRVRVTTDASPLTPLSRKQIFNQSFFQFLEGAHADSTPEAATRYRRLERQIRGVELLSSQEKLMAGLPTFATYFGRDMMMTALMMRPIWSPDMAEHVIASVLRKLGPRGDVSHEEALGGQAIRENAVVYDSLISEYFRALVRKRSQRADNLLGQAREVLRDLQKTRENYHMMDDEFQLPVLEARYLADSAVSPERKRSFLLGSEPGGTRLSLILREMALVASLAQPYTRSPRAMNLVSFPKRDATHWRSASWRDSDVGYAGGRFAMDINVIWVPAALESIATILDVLSSLGFTQQALDSIGHETGGTPLAGYARTPVSLRRALDIWKGARRHFEVSLPATELRRRIQAKLAWLPAEEGRYWQTMAGALRPEEEIRFLALSLDSAGIPIPVMNTDPATGLFLEGAIDPEAVLRDVVPFVLPFPVGLFVAGLGPLVANDAYASPEIWERFRKDPYHGPRVVWGREVNLFLLGIANQLAGAFDSTGALKRPLLRPYVRALDEALRLTLAAVQASGLQHNELWSYEVKQGRLLPIRYGTSGDVQLWNTTNLVVQYVLSKLPPTN
jgi:hypothetical protein